MYTSTLQDEVLPERDIAWLGVGKDHDVQAIGQPCDAPHGEHRARRPRFLVSSLLRNATQFLLPRGRGFARGAPTPQWIGNVVVNAVLCNALPWSGSVWDSNVAESMPGRRQTLYNGVTDARCLPAPRDTVPAPALAWGVPAGALVCGSHDFELADRWAVAVADARMA